MKKGNLRICDKGHRYYKSSDCPTCPICEVERKPKSGFLALLPAPARRALEREGITSIAILATKTEAEILALHGMGPRSLTVLRQALKSANKTFRQK